MLRLSLEAKGNLRERWNRNFHEKVAGMGIRQMVRGYSYKYLRVQLVEVAHFEEKWPGAVGKF